MESLTNTLSVQEKEIHFSTLFFRAKESKRANSVLHDPVSEVLAEKLNLDISRYDKYPINYGEAVAKTKIFDKAVLSFMKQHPDGIVVNLCNGMDTRFMRLDNGTIRWIDINLQPELLDNHNFFEEHERFIIVKEQPGNFSWLKKISPMSKTLFVAENAWLNFHENEIRTLLNGICEHFDSCELLVETMSPVLIKNISERRWKIQQIDEIENWNNKLFLARLLTDEFNERWRLFKYFSSVATVKSTMRIGHFKIG